jgi:hypothetical protein
VSRATREPCPASSMDFAYRTITFYGPAFQRIQLSIEFLTSRRVCKPFRQGPTTPNVQRLQAWHTFSLGSSHFARRYFENRGCFLFLRVLRCFSSPRSPLLPMYSVIDIPELPGMGFPIQKSPGQCLFSGSPKLIAASHVFHRHPAPRHPPSALNSLATNICHLWHNYKTNKAPFKITIPYILFSKSKSKSRILIKVIYPDLHSLLTECKSG